MIGKLAIFITILVLLLAFAPKCSIIYLIDSALSAFNWVDGVHNFNTNDPNYVDGNWQPIHNEKDKIDIRGEGELPKNLVGGMYVRAGANPKCWPPEDRLMNHAFNGEAMLHMLEFLNSEEIGFSNSWIRGEHMNMKTWKPMTECPYSVGFGDIVNGGYLIFPRLLLTKLKMKLMGIEMPPLEMSQPGSTSVVKHAHRVLACTESYLPYEISIGKQGIKSLGFTDLDGMLLHTTGPKHGTFSAHPIIDPETGEMFFFSKNGGPDSLPQIAYGSLFKNGTPNQYFHIPLEKPITSFVHDMFLTKKYAILIDGSVRSDGARLLFGKGITFFDETKPLRFGVVDRSNASPETIKWVTTDSPGHVWHAISAWDNDDETITAFMPKFDKYHDNIDIHLTTEYPSYLTKFTLNLKTGKATEKRILNLVVERPSYNHGAIPRTITYLRSEGESSREMGTEIVKYDLKNEKVLGSFKCEKQEECVFGEAYFVSSTGKSGKSSGAEDDGYLMDIVYHPKTHTSSFLVIDAKTMNSKPVFIAKLPQRVPFGVHGIWFDQEHFNH